MASNSDIPAEPPPSYQEVTGGSSVSRPVAASSSSHSSYPGHASPSAPTSATSTDKTHLAVPGSDKNGIPMAARRSMEDEMRPLPKGWVRTFDPEHEHQFFVDTTKDPPRSSWVHPYDDDQYLSTLSSEERERIEEEASGRNYPPTKENVIYAASDEDEDHHTPTSPGGELPPRPDKGKGKERSFGRKFKDKLTGMTHEQREEERRKRAEEERKLYEQHQKFRRAMAEAQRTGQPQYVGKDRDGKDVYIEPPAPPTSPYGYGNGGYGVNPYRGGVYSTPDARYIRPPNPYARPAYGYGGYGGGYGGRYGGGYGSGLPIGLGVGGGLLGGLLIGDALGGGFGGGGF